MEEPYGSALGSTRVTRRGSVRPTLRRAHRAETASTSSGDNVLRGWSLGENGQGCVDRFSGGHDLQGELF